MFNLNGMGDSIEGAVINKCDPVDIGLGSTVPLENRLFFGKM